MAEPEKQQFEVYRHKQPARAQGGDDNSSFVLIMVALGMVAVVIGGLIFASGGEEENPDGPANGPAVEAPVGQPAPQSVFDRLDWVQDQEGVESALALAEDKYLVEYPNAPNLKKRIEEMRAAMTVGEDVIVKELLEDARKQIGGGNLEEGMATVDQILERTDRQNGEAYFLKASALLQQGDRFGAESALEEAEILGFSPGQVEAMRRTLEEN